MYVECTALMSHTDSSIQMLFSNWPQVGKTHSINNNCLHVDMSLEMAYKILSLLAGVMWYFSHEDRLHLFVDGVYGCARLIRGLNIVYFQRKWIKQG